MERERGAERERARKTDRSAARKTDRSAIGSVIGRNRGPLLAAAVAAGRLGIGVGALADPSLPLRWWVADADVGRTGTWVLARGLGGRDAALALGLVWTLVHGGDVRPWAVAGVLADGGDVLATGLAWRDLPPWRRRFVGTLAAGAAVAGVASVVLDRR